MDKALRVNKQYGDSKSFEAFPVHFQLDDEPKSVKLKKEVYLVFWLISKKYIL